MGSITSANAVYMLGIAGVFPVPQQLQGFSADDVFGTEPIETAELSMGVDGVLSAGFIFREIKQNIMLQADSESNNVFDSWYEAEQLAGEKLIATGLVLLPSIGRKWAMSNGFLTTYSPIPDAKKKLEFRRHGVTWRRISPSVV